VEGEWHARELRAVTGAGLPAVERLRISNAPEADAAAGRPEWLLCGVAGQEQYVRPRERAELVSRQPPLGRPEATRAALIPIKKSAEWWKLPQDRRRAIFEERSRHVETGMSYLPAIARRLLHCRELLEPFDFLTWFEYAPAHEAAFEQLVERLRATEEWRYVEREVDVRLER
jgi:chlorite dismutase